MLDPKLQPIHACGSIDPPHVHVPPGTPISEAISLNGKLWQRGDTITFGFLDGSAGQRRKAQRWAEEWLEVANLGFAFDTTSQPLVRVTFAPGGSWSYIGTDCRNIGSGPTMQFGWVTDSSTDESDRAVIVHECGHMLGLGHEQSSPLNDIQWNKPVALAYYMQTQGWSAQMVEDNVFAVFRADEVTGTAYDRTSIMQYPVDPGLTLDGRGIGWNTDLSPTDRSYVAAIYPGAGTTPPPVTPPVTPPARPPTGDTVTIDGPPVGLPVAGFLTHADFRLTVPADATLYVAASIDGAFGRSPIVAARRGTGRFVTLGLTNGMGRFAFARGDYTISIYNVLAGRRGTARLRVRS